MAWRGKGFITTRWKIAELAGTDVSNGRLCISGGGRRCGTGRLVTLVVWDDIKPPVSDPSPGNSRRQPDRRLSYRRRNRIFSSQQLSPARGKAVCHHRLSRRIDNLLHLFGRNRYAALAWTICLDVCHHIFTPCWLSRDDYTGNNDHQMAGPALKRDCPNPGKEWYRE